jgi:ABC-type branched-subunit amino acid transport system permease subunit
MINSNFKSRTWIANSQKTVGLLCLIAFAAIVPAVFGSYFVSFMRDALLFSLLTISLDYLWGKTGVLSFGHAAFFGAGAYGVAVVSTKSGLNPAYASWVGLLVGIAIAVLVSLLVGYFLIFGRVRGPYFTIVTLALAIIADHIVVGWSKVTGGNAGLLGVLPLEFPGVAGFSPLSPNALYYFVLCAVCSVTFAIWWLCHRRYGFVLRAIEDNEQRAQALGHNTSLHLLVVFTASAAIAALGGGLYASTVGFVAPDIVGLTLSTQAIVWVAIGGRGTLVGPIVATVLVIWLEQFVSSIDTKLWPLVIGGLFILSVFVFPNGLLERLETLLFPRQQRAPPLGGDRSP